MNRTALLFALLCTVIAGCSTAQHRQHDLSARPTYQRCTTFILAGATHTECLAHVASF